MSVSRRRFLAAAVALPFLGPKALDLLEAPPPELLELGSSLPKIRRITARIEITEEALAATQPNRGAFEAWAEEAFESMSEEFVTFTEHYYGAGRKPMIVSDFEWEDDPELDGLLEGVLAPGQLPEPEPGGRYFDTSHLYAGSSRA